MGPTGSQSCLPVSGRHPTGTSTIRLKPLHDVSCLYMSVLPLHDTCPAFTCLSCLYMSVLSLHDACPAFTWRLSCLYMTPFLPLHDAFPSFTCMSCLYMSVLSLHACPAFTWRLSCLYMSVLTLHDACPAFTWRLSMTPFLPLHDAFPAFTCLSCLYMTPVLPLHDACPAFTQDHQPMSDPNMVWGNYSHVFSPDDMQSPLGTLLHV